MMKSVFCSSGRRFGTKEVRTRVVPKLSKAQQDFINQCPAYGLTPDFYQALCVDTNTGAEYYLKGFAGDYCELTGDAVNVFVDFGKVQQMLLDGLNQELAELKDKAELLLGGDDAHDKKLVSEIRKDINARKKCVETSKKYANPAMKDVFAEMGVSDYPGVIYYGSAYEFVSYKPEVGYILENLGRNRYDAGRYTAVSFEVLKDGMKAFANELNSSEVTPWLQMVENMIPADAVDEDDDIEGQLFFAF